MPHILGIDIGTSKAKVILYDTASKEVLVQATEEYRTQIPQQAWAMQNPEDWWKAVCSCIRKVSKTSEGKNSEVEAIGLSGQMHGPVLLDKNNSTIYPCLIWSDSRAKDECELLRNELGNQFILKNTGNPIIEAFTAPKLLWIKRKRPSIFAKINKILLPKDYIGMKLTGKTATDYSDASGTLLFNQKRRGWLKEVIEFLQIPQSAFPRIMPSTAKLGKVNKLAARKTGLLMGTPVIIGGGDLATAALANRVFTSNALSVTIGTAAQIMVFADSLKQNILGKLYFFSHVIPDHLFVMGTIPCGGESLRWFRDTFGRLEHQLANELGHSPYQLLTKIASRSRPGAEGLLFIPYLSGTGNPHLDYQSRGAFIGLTPKHGKSHAIRAIMEGIVYGLKDSLQLIKETEIEIDVIYTAAGGAKSPLWQQIQADIFQKEIVPAKIKDASPLGACMIASTAMGIHENLIKACQEMTELGNSRKPFDKNVEIYEKNYSIFRKIYPKLKSELHCLESHQIENKNNV